MRLCHPFLSSAPYLVVSPISISAIWESKESSPYIYRLASGQIFTAFVSSACPLRKWTWRQYYPRHGVWIKKMNITWIRLEYNSTLKQITQLEWNHVTQYLKSHRNSTSTKDPKYFDSNIRTYMGKWRKIHKRSLKNDMMLEWATYMFNFLLIRITHLQTFSLVNHTTFNACSGTMVQRDCPDDLLRGSASQTATIKVGPGRAGPW